jgi:hypothetical protein
MKDKSQATLAALVGELEAIRDAAGDDGGIAFSGRIRRETWAAAIQGTGCRNITIMLDDVVVSHGRAHLEEDNDSISAPALPGRTDDESQIVFDEILDDIRFYQDGMVEAPEGTYTWTLLEGN